MEERYELSIERIEEINKDIFDNEELEMSLKNYFKETSDFILVLKELKEGLCNGDAPFLKEMNKKLYAFDYSKSFLNNDYAFNVLSNDYAEDAKELAKIVPALYMQLRSCITQLFQGEYYNFIITLELYLEIYGILNQDDYMEDKIKGIKNTLYYFAYDYADEYMEDGVRATVDSELDFIRTLIMNSDLENTDYLYKYGLYVSENEIEVSKHLSKMSQEQIDSMARTYVEGYVEGFNYAGVDLTTKETVNIRFNIGFERIVKSAIKMFEERNLKPVMFIAGFDFRKASPRRIGVDSTSYCRQCDYDHRYDLAYVLNKNLLDRYLTSTRVAFEKYADKAKVYAGPAVMEVFGEEPFTPHNSKNAISPDKKIMSLLTGYNQERNIIMDEFINLSQTSFTIIAYPIPEIGKNFSKIFDETVKINTLDKEKYRFIQEALINELNQGEYVHIEGMNGNKTDLYVALGKLNDPEKESLFENCLADVNIPVGEVFTSPRLKGTKGVLNVSRVYLNGLEYKGLTVEFEDGMISDYSCSNFDNQEDGKKFIEENLMFGHKTLPMGEFAIGTNTYAYVMGRKYNISDKLPILIAEKCGPHFAVGDTCYSMSEDNRVYNQDGKEIVAKDNEVSILRKTDMEKAYFNCHTDITIPYDELGAIIVIKEDGSKVELIRNGRFILPGTEELNDILLTL